MDSDQRKVATSCWSKTVRFLSTTGCITLLMIVVHLIYSRFDNLTYVNDSDGLKVCTLTILLIGLSLLGCYKSIMAIREILEIFMFIIMFITLCMMINFIWAYETKRDTEFDDFYGRSMKNYTWPIRIGTRMEYNQARYDCCGYQSYHDWDQFRPSEEPKDSYPFTCCGWVPLAGCRSNDSSFRETPCSDAIYRRRLNGLSELNHCGQFKVYFLSTFVIALCLMGCYGTIYRSRKALQLFIAIIIGINVNILFALVPADKTKIDSDLDKFYSNSMRNYTWPAQMGSSMDSNQNILSCCGHQSYHDWDQFRPMGAPQDSYPASCCNLLNTTTPCQSSDPTFHKTSCSDRIYQIAIVTAYITFYYLAVLCLLAMKVRSDLRH